jgi:hypothetical protein
MSRDGCTKRSWNTAKPLYRRLSEMLREMDWRGFVARRVTPYPGLGKRGLKGVLANRLSVHHAIVGSGSCRCPFKLLHHQ